MAKLHEKARLETEALRKRIAAHIPRYVNARRKDLGMAQARLSLLSGLHPTMLSGLEGGACANPSIAVCIMLARALECSLADLIGIDLDTHAKEG